MLARDRGICQRCGDPATIADHVIPLALGGPDTEANMQALCAPCNLTKGAT